LAPTSAQKYPLHSLYFNVSLGELYYSDNSGWHNIYSLDSWQDALDGKVDKGTTVSYTPAGTVGDHTYTPAGTISQPAFSGTSATISVSGTPTGSVEISTGAGAANYTPSGSVS
jgi:hypothetical protein